MANVRLDVWEKFSPVHGHRLTVHEVGTFTLDDEAADTDPDVVEDGAIMYAVQCQSCWQMNAARAHLGMPAHGQVDIAHFAVNRRTGEWLVSRRPGIDDPAQDTVGLVLEHCRNTLVPLPDLAPESPDRNTGLLGYGDPVDVDEDALAAARMLVGFGRSPWEALGMYAASISANPATTQ